MKINQNFLGEGGGGGCKTKNLPLQGGKWIFSGIAQSICKGNV